MATPTDTKEEPKKVQKTSTKQLTSFLSSLRSLNPFTPPSSTPTSRLFSRLPHPTTILFIGLEGSGKTTLLRDYLSPRPENVEKVYHSDGIRVENLQVGSALFQGYDTGTCRPPTWHEFEEQLFARADGVVYMVDAADRDGIMESREELIMHGLRADDGGMREGIPLLVLATKVDLMDARRPDQIETYFIENISTSIGERPTHAEGVNLRTGEGVLDALSWLSKTVRK